MTGPKRRSQQLLAASKQPRVRAALSDDVFRELYKLCRCKDRALDGEQLRRLVQRAVDRSWLVHRAIETGAYSRWMEAQGRQRAAADAVTSTLQDLKAALDDPQPRIDLLAVEALAQRFVKARRKLQAVGNGIEKAIEQAVRDFKEIEFMDRDRLTAALTFVDGELVMSAWTVPKNGRGRKPAKKDHFECRHFVHELLTAVRRSGGRLSFDRNANRGALRDAFEYLAPDLPHRVRDSKSARLFADVNQNWPTHTTDLEIPLWLGGFLTEMIKAGKFAIFQGKES
jgi:hypothetical protein